MISHQKLQQPIQGVKKENDIHYCTPEHAIAIMQKYSVNENVSTKKTQKRRKKKLKYLFYNG
jgi:hypothetical protein